MTGKLRRVRRLFFSQRRTHRDIKMHLISFLRYNRGLPARNIELFPLNLVWCSLDFWSRSVNSVISPSISPRLDTVDQQRRVPTGSWRRGDNCQIVIHTHKQQLACRKFCPNINTFTHTQTQAHCMHAAQSVIILDWNQFGRVQIVIAVCLFRLLRKYSADVVNFRQRH